MGPKKASTKRDQFRSSSGHYIQMPAAQYEEPSEESELPLAEDVFILSDVFMSKQTFDTARGLFYSRECRE